MELNLKGHYFGLEVIKVITDIAYQCNLRCHNSTEPIVSTVVFDGVFKIFILLKFSH